MELDYRIEPRIEAVQEMVRYLLAGWKSDCSRDYELVDGDAPEGVLRGIDAMLYSIKTIIERGREADKAKA